MLKPLCRPMLLCMLLTIFFGVAPSAIRGSAPVRSAGSATLSGTIWHVPGEFADIQSALDAAASGDMILVAAGSYTGSLNFNAKDMTLQSVAGPTATAIVGSGGASVTIGPQGALIGFTISHGVGYDGGGLTVTGMGTVIRGNTFIDNAALVGGSGAAIGSNGASPLIDSNIFRHNSCDMQFSAGVVSFLGTSSPQIINNLFIDNPCRAINMTMPIGSTPLVYNNTIIGNPVGIRVDARVPAVAQIYRNNLIVGNTVGLAVDFSVAAAYNPTWEYNLVFGNTSNYEGIPDQTGLQHNISADPLFVDAAHGVFILQAASPAVDGGSNAQCPTHDLWNIVRPQGQACDIGAYELIHTKIYIPLIRKP